MSAAEAVRLLTPQECHARIDRMADDWGRGRDVGGDRRLLTSMRVNAALDETLPFYGAPVETPLRKAARQLAEKIAVCVRFAAPADDVVSALVKLADLYTLADEVEP